MANSAIEQQIRKMVRTTVREFRPEQVTLFGSHGRGDAGPDSDVDLLVVMPVKGPKYRKQIQIRVALHGLAFQKTL